MKLLHVISSLEIGGAQRLLSDLLPIQKEQGLEVSLLVYENIDNAFSNKIKEAGVPIIALNKKNYKDPSIVLLIRNIIRNYDIVHVHLFPSSYWVAIAAIGLKRPTLFWTEHSTSNRRRGKWYLRPIEKWIYHQYARVISISEQTQIALQDWLQSTDNRFVIIPNGIDTKVFANIQRKIKPKSLIMVSRFVPAKDQETVIKAMKYIDKNASLRFVGDGETLDECKRLAKEEGESKRIEFLGAQSDVATLISESYIGIQSSHWEGFGLTAIELMSAGKPVIASNVNGLKQVVEGAGVIFEGGNEMQLAESINHLLRDDNYYALTSAQCKKRALQYDIHVMAEQYKNLYLSFFII